MRWMRSRWTVVALVPACFLASFAIVSALRGSDDAAPAAAESDGAGGSAPPPATVVDPTTTGEAEPDADTTTGANGSGSDNRGTTGDGEAGGTPAPPPGTIAVDYGRWEGMFEISDTEIVPEFGLTTVTGQFRYLGGVDCQVGFVGLRGRFYDGSGRSIGTGAWESIWATGEGAEVPQREPLYLEFSGPVVHGAESAQIRFSKVECL